jgi:hypothetical protein
VLHLPGLIAALLASQVALPSPPPPGPPEGAISPASPAERYAAARAALLRGELGAAADRFAEVASDPAAGELARPARELASACAELARTGRFVLEAPQPTAGQAGPGGPRPSRDQGGRAELALYQTVHGAWVGTGAGLLLGLTAPKAYAALAVLGAGTGLTLSLGMSRGTPMSAGRADAINSATSWGTFNGALASAVSGASLKGGVALSLAGGLGGLVLVSAATSRRSPTAGDVALVNSGGVWGVASGIFLVMLTDPTARAGQATVLLAADAGLLTMALLARRLELSRGRSLLIDAGGVLGVLTGLALPVILGSSSQRAYASAGLAGMATGLATAAWLSRGWDLEEHGGLSVAPAILPLPGQRLVAGLAGRF